MDNEQFLLIDEEGAATFCDVVEELRRTGLVPELTIGRLAVQVLIGTRFWGWGITVQPCPIIRLPGRKESARVAAGTGCRFISARLPVRESTTAEMMESKCAETETFVQT